MANFKKISNTSCPYDVIYVELIVFIKLKPIYYHDFIYRIENIINNIEKQKKRSNEFIGHYKSYKVK